MFSIGSKPNTPYFADARLLRLTHAPKKKNQIRTENSLMFAHLRNIFHTDFFLAIKNLRVRSIFLSPLLFTDFYCPQGIKKVTRVLSCIG